MEKLKVVELAHFSGYTHPEIAELLDNSLTPRPVRSPLL
jgi:hypothetical protein